MNKQEVEFSETKEKLLLHKEPQTLIQRLAMNPLQEIQKVRQWLQSILKKKKSYKCILYNTGNIANIL